MTIGTHPADSPDVAPELASDLGPANLDEARRLLVEAEAKLRRWDAPLEVALLAVVDRRFTNEIATMAVRLRADGIATLLVNSAFVLDIGAEGCAFGLCHEAMHLLLNHLRYDGPRDDARRWACRSAPRPTCSGDRHRTATPPMRGFGECVEPPARRRVSP